MNQNTQGEIKYSEVQQLVIICQHYETHKCPKKVLKGTGAHVCTAEYRTVVFNMKRQHKSLIQADKESLSSHLGKFKNSAYISKNTGTFTIT